MVWPVLGRELADDAAESSCTGKSDPGHDGYDLRVRDEEPLYAVFPGTIHVGKEVNFPNWYNLGLYIRLESDEQSSVPPIIPGVSNPRYVAIYGHLMNDSLPEDGVHIERAGFIGFAGGGQESDDRGDSPGPRLYFELYDNDLAEYVDPYTCVTDTCNFWYTDGSQNDCVPNLDNTEECVITPYNSAITPGVTTLAYKGIPSYACITGDYDSWGGVTLDPPGEDTRYYARLTVDAWGRLNSTRALGCIPPTPGPDQICASDVFDHNITPLNGRGNADNFDSLNCFLRLIRVHGDGTYTCGSIMPNGEVNMEFYDQDWCNHNIVSIGRASKDESENFGFNRIYQITQGNSSTYGTYVVVSSEYEIIGVNDQNLTDALKNGRNINLQWKNDPLEDHKGLADAGAAGTFNPNADDYYVDFILVRQCDNMGLWDVDAICKVELLIGSETLVDGEIDIEGIDYDVRIKESGYESCEYIMVDAGKMFDEPGRFQSTWWVGRVGANLGMTYYVV